MFIVIPVKHVYCVFCGARYLVVVPPVADGVLVLVGEGGVPRAGQAGVEHPKLQKRLALDNQRGPLHLHSKRKAQNYFINSSKLFY